MKVKSVFIILSFAATSFLTSCSSSPSDEESRGLRRTPESVERCQRDCENYPRNSARVIETCKQYCEGGRSINGGTF